MTAADFKLNEQTPSQVPIVMLQVAIPSFEVLVEECRRELAPESAGRAVRWEVGPLPPARGDPAMLRLVWRNLLSNALKYSRTRPQAQVRVEGEQQGAECVYRVRDNGVGFDASQAGLLFGVFQRLHGEAEFEGTGVGLANVRRIVERHGGRVWAEAREGQGATFGFSLPALAPEGQAP